MLSPMGSIAYRCHLVSIDRCGQGTVEFVIVLCAFMALIGGLGALWHVLGDGIVVQHAITSASHNIAGAAGAWADVFAY